MGIVEQQVGNGQTYMEIVGGLCEYGLADVGLVGIQKGDEHTDKGRVRQQIGDEKHMSGEMGIR